MIGYVLLFSSYFDDFRFLLEGVWARLQLVRFYSRQVGAVDRLNRLPLTFLLDWVEIKFLDIQSCTIESSVTIVTSSSSTGGGADSLIYTNAY